MLKSILKWLGVAIALIAMLATVILSLTIYKTLFSGNLAAIVVSAIFIAYVLLTSYISGFLLLWISFWSLPRWLVGTLAVISSATLVFILGLVAVAYNAGPSGVVFILPHLIYLISIFRLTRNFIKR